MYVKTKLEDILELHRGYDLPECERAEGNIPIISSSGYSGVHNDFKCDGENVITGRYGTIGEVFYHKGKCWPLNTALYVSDFKGNNAKYIYYLLKCFLKKLADGKDKSTVPGVDRNVLHQMKVPFCKNIPTQKQIIKALETVDRKIELNKQINDNLAAMIYDFYMHEFFRRESNGKLGDIISEEKKSTIQVGTAKNLNGEYPFFTSGDAVLSCDKPLVNNRICLLNTGGNADVKFYVGPASYSTDAWCITGTDGLSDYLFTLLYSIKQELNLKFFLGTGLKHLQKPLLKNRPIYIPNEIELKTFNSIAMPAYTTISSNQRDNRALISLRDWLLPMLMNGQATIED